MCAKSFEYADAADFIANKNPKIFYIRGDAKYYRYEFNFVLCWLLQDMIGREMKRHNNKNVRKASLYNCCDITKTYHN